MAINACLSQNSSPNSHRGSAATCSIFIFKDIVGSYASPAQALDAARNSPPDVLFLDIDMPGIDGLALRQQLMHIPICRSKAPCQPNDYASRVRSLNKFLQKAVSFTCANSSHSKTYLNEKYHPGDVHGLQCMRIINRAVMCPAFSPSTAIQRQ